MIYSLCSLVSEVYKIKIVIADDPVKMTAAILN